MQAQASRLDSISVLTIVIRGKVISLRYFINLAGKRLRLLV